MEILGILGVLVSYKITRGIELVVGRALNIFKGFGGGALWGVKGGPLSGLNLTL